MRAGRLTLTPEFNGGDGWLSPSGFNSDSHKASLSIHVYD